MGGEAATASTARDDDVVARARWGSGCDACASGADEYEEANEASLDPRERRVESGARKKTIARAIWSIHWPFFPLDREINNLTTAISNDKVIL